MAAAFRWIRFILSAATLLATNFILVGTLPLLPSGMLILHAGGVIVSTLPLILTFKLDRSVRERSWGRAIATMVIWLPALVWNWAAAVVTINVVAHWGVQPATTTQLFETPTISLYDTLVALMGLVVVLAASLMPYVSDGESSVHGAGPEGADAHVVPAGGRVDPVWSDEVAVHSSEQRSDADPPPRHPPYPQASSARRPSGVAAQEILRILLALPEQTSYGLHKRGCHIDCTQSALARETGFSKSTVNAAIHKLHRDGRLSVQTWALHENHTWKQCYGSRRMA